MDISEYLELIKTLVRVGAVSSEVAKVNRSQEIMAEFLAAHGVRHLTFEEFADGRKVLFAANRPGKVQEIILNAHLDVVPPVFEQQLEPVEKDGWLVGRGTGDDLGNAAICAAALIRLLDSARSVGVIFSADEEIGGNTTAGMVERGYRATGLAVVMDSSPYVIDIAEKGILVLEVKAIGKSCHAAYPWLGENAADKLLEGYAKLREFLKTKRLATEDDQWHETFQLCQLKGSDAENQVPGEASLVLNVRYPDPARREAIVEEVRAATGCQVTIQRECPPVYSDENSPVLQRMLRVMQECFPGKDVKFHRMNGATDARHMVGWKVPIACAGADHRNIHGGDEALRIDAIAPCIEWLVRSLAR